MKLKLVLTGTDLKWIELDEDKLAVIEADLKTRK